MDSTERVRRTILGQETDRQPIYGWVAWNLLDGINERYGSVANFEDKYEFDMAHIFGGPGCFEDEKIKELREKVSAAGEEFTPDVLLSEDIYRSPLNDREYDNIRDAVAFHKKRGRFCYLQTPGFFEHFNGQFGIENQLMYLALYEDELAELYAKQAEWTVQFVDMAARTGVDMIHISDDWGAQKDMMFSPVLWKKLIYPNLKKVVDRAHENGLLCSLHSDGCISKVCDDLAEIGFDCIHPWQEKACMGYDFYLNNYSDKFAILGGICVQSSLGLLPQKELGEDIERVFSLLRHKRWICCTTHFVQSHCTIDDLGFAYDLIYRLARE